MKEEAIERGGQDARMLFKVQTKCRTPELVGAAARSTVINEISRNQRVLDMSLSLSLSFSPGTRTRGPCRKIEKSRDDVLEFTPSLND